MITRDEYMKRSGELGLPDDERKRLHHEYYAQFVSKKTISHVLSCIGATAIRGSRDEHMNDIPLELWDRLRMADVIDHNLWRMANGHENKSTYPWSKADNVCIGKTAARVWLLNRGDN